MQNLKERVSWAISTIKEDKFLGGDISDADLAKELGITENTLKAYKNGQGSLKSPVIENLVSKYNFNPTWLYKGQSEPFPGARQKYKDVCGPETTESVLTGIPQPTARSGAPAAIPQPFQIDLGEDVRLAIEVLSSNTHYASSLHMNIHSFAAAVADNKRLTALEDKMTCMESRMEEMIVQNKALQKEVNRLKATYEDPDGGSGSLTNTSGND